MKILKNMKKQKKISIFLIMGVSLLSLSWYPHEWVGLLTDDYGIVTVDDLAEEEAWCSVQPFSVSNKVGCFQYWQCLPTENVFIACEDLGKSPDPDVLDPMGHAVFRIKNGDMTHYFYTRRNWSMDVCYEWAKAWTELMIDEPIVCISGMFSGVTYEPPFFSDIFLRESDEEHSSEYYWWRIDRMKSPRGEWSYFLRSSYENSSNGYSVDEQFEEDYGELYEDAGE